mmetsp:Transcript_65538/g.156662  ORF Transcript_65538/g.156662 Transcript_65538/m.156662 type:complete len:284 (+) Transcript_65538:79-930(+)
MVQAAVPNGNPAWRRRMCVFCSAAIGLVSAAILGVVVWQSQNVDDDETMKKPMSCGSAALCGVLALETGLGSGLYHHAEPSVHGLWPETPPYGTSRCIRPKSKVAPSSLPSCYRNQEAAKDPEHEKEFVDHEWTKHGSCAGTINGKNFFQQICNMSEEPLKVMAAGLQKSHDIHALVSELEKANFSVHEIDSEYGQILLSACGVADASGNYVWKLAAEANFNESCSSGGPTPSPPAPPTPGASCQAGLHGPACQTDADCKNVAGCVRCAHSGYCTDQPVSVVV